MSRLRVLGRIDRYVARLFVLSYLTAFFLVVGLFLILDMATKLDDYLQPGADGTSPPLWMVAHFYLLEVPFLYLQMSPFVTLVAGLFTTARLAKANEIVAVLNAGVSARRLLAPVFLGAGLLALGMVGLREWATAELGRQRDVLQDQLLERRERPVYSHFWIRDTAGRKLRLQLFQPAIEAGDVARFELMSSSYREGRRWIVVTADAGTWNPELGVWELERGLRVEDTPDERKTEEVSVLTDVDFTPADVELAYRGRERPEGLSLDELRLLLAREPSSATLRTLFHYNMTFPLAGLVLLLVGLPFLVGQERGRAVERIAKGFFLCLVYFGVDFVSRTLGMQGELGPIHAGWLPIVVFGSLGLVLFAGMKS